jgi:hypothetical protein
MKLDDQNTGDLIRALHAQFMAHMLYMGENGAALTLSFRDWLADESLDAGLDWLTKRRASEVAQAALA